MVGRLGYAYVCVCVICTAMYTFSEQYKDFHHIAGFTVKRNYSKGILSTI